MLRIRIGGQTLLLGLLMILALNGCVGQTSPVAIPTPTPSKPLTVEEMTPIVRDFLANLPQGWGLTQAQDVARNKSFVVDVRQPDEYGKGFIEGAVNIPLRELVRNLQSLPAMEQTIVLVCDSGHRSAIGMTALQMLGYKSAKSLAGGMQSWQAAKLPVVTQPIPQRASGAPPKVNANLQATLDHYLTDTLPNEWGVISPANLAEDQKRKSTLETEIQPETYDQGASILVDVTEPSDFAQTTLPKAINIPIRGLAENFQKIPAEKITLWF